MVAIKVVERTKDIPAQLHRCDGFVPVPMEKQAWAGENLSRCATGLIACSGRHDLTTALIDNFSPAVDQPNGD